MNTPTLRQMQYLVALEDHKSFSKAADACFVTQSTLSAGIKDMEDLLGHKVIDRSRRKVIFTPLGLDLVAQARTILAQVNHMTEQAQHLATPMSGPLRLGVIPTIAPYMLPDILPGLNKAFPALDLQLQEDLSGRLLEKLENGTLDVALLAFPYITPGMEQMSLFDEPFYLACPTDQAPKAKAVKNADLNPDELLLLEDGHCLRDHVIKACGLQRPRQRKTFSATSLQTLIQMVRYGYGMTLLPEMAIESDMLPDGVTLIPFADKPAPSREIGLIWRKGSPRSADFKELGALLKNL